MTLLQSLRSMPRTSWVLAIATFINRAGTMVLPFLALYLTKTLNFPIGRAGFVLTLYGLGALLTAPVAGRLCDRYGPVLIMKLSLFASAVVMFLFPVAHSYGAVIAATLLLSVTVEMFRPASMATVSRVVEGKMVKQAFAVQRAAINLGMSIGPAMAGFLATFSFLWLFLIDGITSVLAGFVLVFTMANLKAVPKEPDLKAKGGAPVFRDPALLIFMAAVIPVGIIFFQHMSAMPLFMVENLHFSPAVYGLMFTINTGLIVFLEVPLNHVTSHWTHRRNLVLGTVLCAIGFGSLAFVTDIIGVVATVLVWTFGEMILFPSMSAYVAHIAPEHSQGKYMGFYMMAFSVAFMIGPWAGTQVLEHLGPVILWNSMFVLGAASATIFWILTANAGPIETTETIEPIEPV
jgi:MFS family permease